MYQFKDEVHENVFFRFDKLWIENMNWALLPKSSKAILPVIAVHCNKDEIAFPSEQTIAILSGLTEKTVREGIKGLLGFPGFKLDHYVTKCGRRANKFMFIFPPEDEKGRCFFFNKSIIEGGNWRFLKPVSKALYPVMRHFANFDLEVYLQNHEYAYQIYHPDKDFKEFYKAREWDICGAEIPIMAEYANITRPSVYEALNDLTDKELIKPMAKSRWKVFLSPHRTYNKEFLNREIIRRYGEKNDL